MKTMKISFINPPYAYVRGIKEKVSSILPPINLAYIAAVLEKDHEVQIIDIEALAMNLEDLKRMISQYQPDVVGITVTTSTLKISLEIARIAKAASPDCKVVVGGPHPTVVPEVVKHKEVDIAVIGEGEYTILELTKAIEEGADLKNVKGIVFERNSSMVITPPRALIENLDELPFPARHLLSVDRYRPSIHRDFRRPFTTMMTSRGCPFNCTYCTAHRIHGRKLRLRSPENVVAEIEEVIKDFGVKEVQFWDDNLTVDKERIEQICNLIVQKGIDIAWTCSTRVNLVDKELLKRMRDAGCKMIFYGVESGCQEILNVLKRNMSLHQIRKAFKWTEETGIYTTGSFMLGSPGETRETIGRTIQFAKELNPDFATFFITAPYPGSELYQYALNENLIEETDWLDYETFRGEPWGVPVLKLKGLTREDLQESKRRAIKSFYFRPAYVMKRISKPHFIRYVYRMHHILGAFFSMIAQRRGRSPT